MAGAATDAVWIDVLPSMRGFGPALSQGVGREAEAAGRDAGGKFGKAMLAGVAVVAGGAALATKALYNIGSTFNDLRTNIAVNTGAAGKDLDRMTDAAKRIGLTVPRSFEDIGQAVVTVRSNFSGFADMTDAEFDQATTNALNFSKAFEVDMGRATQVAAQMLKNGLVSDANEAFDLLTAASQKVPVSLREDLLDAVDEYGPFFKQIGLSGEDAMNALVKSSEKGMYGLDKTGDALKEFTIRATDMSTASKVGYDILGMSQEDMSRKLLAGGESGKQAFQTILEGIQGIKDPVKQSQAALALFGTPLEDLSTGEIPKFIDGLRTSTNVLGEVDGAAQRMGENLNSGPGAAFQLFKNKLIDTVAPAAEKVFGLFTTGLDAVTKSGFADWVQRAAGFVSGSLLPALGDLTNNILPVLRGAFEGVGTAVSAVVGFFKEHETAAKALMGTVAFVAGFIAAAWVAQGVVATVNAAKSVIAWFATATAATTSSTIQSKSTAQIVAGWLIASASATWNALKIAAAWAVGVAETGVLMALYASQSIASAARSAAAWVAAQIRTVASLAVTAAGFVAQGAVMLASMAVTAAGVVASWVLMGVQSLIRAAQMAAAWVIAMGPVGWVIAAVIGLVAIIIANWDTVKAWTIAIWNAVVGFIKDAASAIWSWVTEKFTALKNGVIAIFTAVRDVVVAIWNGFKDAIVAAAKFIWDMVVAYFNFWKLAVTTIFTTVRDVVVGIWNGFRDTIVAVAQWIWEKVVGFFNTMKSGVVNIYTGIRDTVVGVWTGFRDTVVGIAKNIWDWVVEKFTNLKNAAVSIFTGIKDTIKSVWDKIVDVVKAPLRIVFDFVNNNMIGPVNSILGKFPGGLHIPELPHLAEGGLLRGPGTGTSDSILGVDPKTGVATAAVSNGEFVINAKQTRKHLPLIRAINAGIGQFATGGLVSRFGVPGFSLGGWLSDRWDDTKGIASSTWNAAKTAVSSIGNFASDMIAKGARKAAEWILNPIRNAAHELIPDKVPFSLLTGGIDKLYNAVLGKGDEKDREMAAANVGGGGSGTPGMGSDAIKAFIRSVDPLPYIWGGTGPGGYDCSGLAGEVFALMTGRQRHRRYFTTGSIGDGSQYGFKPGLGGTLNLGFNSHHVVGDYGGLGFEARSTATGIFTGAAATNPATMPKKMHLASGGKVGDAVSALLGLGIDVGGDIDNTAIGLPNGKPVKLFDTGGLWKSGTAGFNLTGGVERVLTPPQDDYFRKFVDATHSSQSAPGSTLPPVHLYTPDIPHAIRALRAEEQQREALAPTW